MNDSLTSSDNPTFTSYRPENVLPANGSQGTWVGRVWVPASKADNGLAGPRVVCVSNGTVSDLSRIYPTMTELVNSENPVDSIRSAGTLPELLPLDELLENSLFANRASRLQEEESIVLLAPNDLLATKACGVTFVKSLLERVVEEKAGGDAGRAQEIRAIIMDSLGSDLSTVKPGSPETDVLKKRFQEAGIWSQYLEVGIGKDAEVFTKHQPMASVSYGAEIGVLPDSNWNNPEPEVVLAISKYGKIVGATLGNDVNLRDYEGRSALLLGEAKDQNGSCSIGPFFRLFDEGFSLEIVKNSEIELTITGADGFRDSGRNRMAEISRPPEDLAAQAIGDHHQYPDGLVLFLGTMFAPTADRGQEGQGFTHKIGDRVEIASPELGRLVNWVNHTDRIQRWDYGISDLIEYISKSSLQETKIS
ncbi:MAG: fumarylacetoacetate hydrolase family protein [Verrucomicrobiota bacterium]